MMASESGASRAGWRSRRPGGGRWIWGLHAVREALLRAPQLVEEIRVGAGKWQANARQLVERARGLGVPVREGDAAFLANVARGGRHQGVAARVCPYRYADLAAIAESAAGVMLILDCVQDPRNLGAILRTAGALGAAGVVLPRDRATGVTPAAIRSAGGYVHCTPVARVANVARTVELLKTMGWWVWGLVPRGGRTVDEAHLPGRLALVLGGEGKGMRPLVVHVCDELVSIPMAEGVDSLNVAVAAGVALYAALHRAGAAAGCRGG